MTMSDVKPFREVYAIHYQGLDTARYVVVQRDTTLAINVSSNGFQALRRSLKKSRPVTFDVTRWQRQQMLHSTGDIQLSMNTIDLLEDIQRQLPMRGVSNVEPLASTLSVVLSERESRRFAPIIDSVEFVFDGTCGLSDSPVVTPDSVVLYGSRASLDKISELRASSQSIGPIHRSGKHRVQLYPVWRQYPDLRISSPYVVVSLPVKKFIEKTVQVPVEFRTEEKIAEAHLYPAAVDVVFWITEEEYNSVDANHFQAIANYTADAGNQLEVLISQFPANVRIKEVKPKEVQYTIIK